MPRALVLHTQTAKLARWPTLTCEPLGKDCTSTQSCGVFFTGGGELRCERDGVGLGFGELGLGLGLGLLCGFDGLGDGTGVVLDGFVGLGLGELDGLVELVGLADVVRLADLVGLADVLRLADVLPTGDRAGLVDWLALAVTRCLRYLTGRAAVAKCVGASAVTVVIFGIDEQAREFTAGRLPTSTASASDAILTLRNAKPVTAPSAAARRIFALTIYTLA